MIIDELITLLTFNVKGKDKAEAYKAITEQIGDIAKATTIALGGTITAIGYFAKEVADSTAQNYSWAKSAGIATDTYQKIAHAAETVGYSLDDVKDDMEMWARTSKATGESIESIFLREASAIQGMSEAQSKALLTQKGYSQGAIKMIQSGETELKKMFAETQVIPKENLENALKFSKAWNSAVSQVKTAMVNGVSSALPAIQGLVQILSKFVTANKDVVSTYVGAFFTSVAVAAKGLFYAIYPLVWTLGKIAKGFDLVTLGMGKYLVIVPVLTALIIAFAVATGIKLYMAFQSLAVTTGLYITKMIQLVAVTRGYLARQFVMRAATLAQNTADGVSITLQNAKKMGILALMKAQLAYYMSLVKQKAVKIATNAIDAIAIVKTWALVAAQWALNAALYANPIVAIVAGVIVALGAIIGIVILIVKYWNEIISAIKTAWKWTVGIWSWMKNGESTMAKILKWAFAILAPISLLYFYWDEICGAISKAGSFIKDVFVGMVEKSLEFDKKIFATFWDWITNGFAMLGEDLLNFLISPLEAFSKALKSIPGLKQLIGFVEGKVSSATGNETASGTSAVSNIAKASPSMVNNNSNKSIVVNNNNTINTTASSGPAIANYLGRTNVLQGAGYGMVGTT